MNISQQRKLENFDSIEEECTGGYDSDGELGPFFDVNEGEGEHDVDKDSRPVSQPVLVEEDEDESTTSNPEYETPCHVPIEDAVLAKMKVAEIWEEIKNRKDPEAGLKALLIDRPKKELGKESHVHRDISTNTAKKSSTKNKTTGVCSISEDSWRKVLETITIVEEPTNPTFKLPHAPEVAEEEANYVPHRFDFAEKFDQPVFEIIAKRKV